MQYLLMFFLGCLPNSLCMDTSLKTLRHTVSIANEIFSQCGITIEYLHEDITINKLTFLANGGKVLAHVGFSNLHNKVVKVEDPLTCQVIIRKSRSGFMPNNGNDIAHGQLIDFQIEKYDGMDEKYEIYANNDTFAIVNAKSKVHTHTCIIENNGIACKYVKVLRMVYDSWSPLFNNEKDGFSGIMYDVLVIVVGRLGLELELVMNNDPGRWGTQSSSNSTHWRGMVGMVQQGLVDGCTAGTAITSERSDIVDFTFSSLRITSDMFARHPHSEQVSWENYLLEFDLATWGCIVITGFVLVIALAVVLSSGFTVNRETLSLATSIVIRAFLLKGTNIEKSTFSFRSTFLITLLFFTVILVCYRSTMNAFLAVIKPTRMNSLEDVLNHSKGLTMWSPSLMEHSLSTMPPKSSLGKLYTKFTKDPNAGYTDYVAGLKKVKEHNYVMADSYQLIRALPEYDCNVYKLDIGYFDNSYISFFFAKNSPYVLLFNKEIIKLRNQGVLERIVLHYWPEEAKSDRCTERVTALGMVSVFTPFLLVIFGILASIFLSILERFSNYLSYTVGSRI